MTKISAQTSLESRARQLGLDYKKLTKLAKSQKKLENTIEELESKFISASHYLDHLKELTDLAVANIHQIADSPSSKIIASNFESQMKNTIAQNLDQVPSRLIGGHYQRSCQVTSDIIDKGLEFIGYPHNDDKEREKMRKYMIAFLALLATIFLKYLGISPETIAIAGFALSFISNNSKSPYEKAVLASSKILEAKNIAPSNILNPQDVIPEVNPGIISNPAIRALELQGHDYTKHDSVTDKFFESAKRLISVISSINSPESALTSFKSDIDSVVEICLKNDKPLQQKLNNTINNFLLSEAGQKMKKEITAAISRSSGTKIIHRTESLISSISSIDNFMDSLRMNIERDPNYRFFEKIKFQKIAREVRNHLFETYSKPVIALTEVAQMPANAELSRKLGFTSEIIREFTKSASKLIRGSSSISR